MSNDVYARLDKFMLAKGKVIHSLQVCMSIQLVEW